MRLNSILSGLVAALALSTAASAAIVVDVHAEGSALGTIPAIIYNGAPIILDATFDLSKGIRSTSAIVDQVRGNGSDSPGRGSVSLEFLPASGWGETFSSFAFAHSGPNTTFALTLVDPSVTYAFFLVVNRPDDLFMTLDTIPVGEFCAGAVTCYGGIVDPTGTRLVNDVDITWSEVTLTLRDTGAIPEPATWAFMLLGFGGAGAMLRRRRAVLAQA